LQAYRALVVVKHGWGFLHDSGVGKAIAAIEAEYPGVKEHD
jgi:hypothetical protein